MNSRILIIGALVLIVAGGGYYFWNKKKTGPAVDPAVHHTAGGTFQNMKEFYGALEDALKRNDLRYIHDHMYYLKGLAQVIPERVDAETRQRLSEPLQEFIRTTEELDHFAGRGNQAAVEAGLKKLAKNLADIEAQLKNGG